METDESIDCLVLVAGQEEEDNGEWKGLTQTMRKMVYSKLDEVKETMMYELKNEMKEIKSDNKLLRSDMAEIKSLIQEMKKTE